jgi:hypothetical protein
MGHKLSDIIFIFIATYHKLHKIKNYLLPPEVSPAVGLWRKCFCVKCLGVKRVAIGGREKRTDLPFALKVAPPSRLPVTGETPALR